MSLPRRSPLVAFAGLLGFQVLLQGRVLFLQGEAGLPWSSGLGGGLLGLLLDDVALAAALAALVGAVSSGRGALRALGLGAVLATLGYLLLDHVHTLLFARGLGPEGLREGSVDVGAFRDSLAAELGPGALGTMLVALALSWVVGQGLRQAADQGGGRRPLALAFACALAASALPTSPVAAARHPLRQLAVALSDRARWSPGGRSREPGLDLVSLRHGRPRHDPGSEAGVVAYGEWRRRRSRIHRPNVVLLVLESVGALNALGPDGLPDPEALPTLHAWRDRALVFPRVYTSFPGTTRSHVTLLTGGPTPTHGDVAHVLSFRYQGPTLLRALKALGYETALFSTSFPFHSLPALYRHEPLDAGNFPFDVDDPRYRDDALDSWGISERVLPREVGAWLAGRAEPGRPLALVLHNQATHHPDAVPADPPSPFPGDDPWSRYRAAMHFTDAALAAVLAQLESRGLLEDALVLVCGDHGEAFGRRHPGNRMHREQLYDENVLDFLLLIDTGREPTGPLVSRKQAGLGDLFPTLVGLVGGEAPPVAGQDLTAPGYRERLHFFHKFALPERVGLVDGRYKFTLEVLGWRRPALFDLEVDPSEQRDVAAERPEQVATYTRLVAEWYARSEEEFEARLEGYRPPEAPDPEAPGPLRVEVGVRVAAGAWSARRRLAPAEQPVARLYLRPYPEDTTLTVTFYAPSGEYTKGFPVAPGGAAAIDVPLGAPAPHLAGVWRVAVYRKRVELAAASFEVGVPEG